MGEAGWYTDPYTLGQRWWDGQQWTEYTLLGREDRQDRLDTALAGLLAQGGRIESRTAYQAVVLAGRDTNHTVHVILSVCTCGLWLPIWLLAAGTSSVRRVTVFVDPYGAVTYS